MSHQAVTDFSEDTLALQTDDLSVPTTKDGRKIGSAKQHLSSAEVASSPPAIAAPHKVENASSGPHSDDEKSADATDETNPLSSFIFGGGLRTLIEEVRAKNTPNVRLAEKQYQNIEKDLAMHLLADARERALESLRIVVARDLGVSPSVLRRMFVAKRTAPSGKSRCKPTV